MPSNANPTRVYEAPGLSRRGFLRLATKSLLVLSSIMGLGGLLKYLAYNEPSGEPQVFDLGKVVDYAPGSRIMLGEAQAMLIHNGQGLQAISLVCPHLGCRVKPDEDGFACPCHGSHFTEDGSLQRGPAAGSLRSLPLEQTPEGRLILQVRDAGAVSRAHDE